VVAADAYARAVAAVPELGALIAIPPDAAPLPGPLLADAGWLAERVAVAGDRWRIADPRVIGTLWWYAASSTLLAPPVITLLVIGRPVDLSLKTLTLYLRSDGYLGGGRTTALADADPERLGLALREHLGAVIAPLAAVSGATERALWAIAADSLANWALRAGYALGAVDRAEALAGAVAEGIGPVMPTPRYVDVSGPPTRRYVRRCSCCLIFELAGMDKCTSCPRQPPADRLRRLAAHARTT
jgi:ferric iron reductase protein FhuF